MNDLNYSPMLTKCMGLSAAALALGVALPTIPPLAAFLGALAPLVWYHVVFLRPRAANGLSQPAIDSVYYYGFLVTIGALGATALDLSLYGIGEDFSSVAFQFGLGLLATGYAVFARVQLTASAKILDEDELRTLMGQQIARSRELLANVELASASFESYATTLLQRSQQFAEDAEARTRASIDAAVAAFSSGVAAMCEQAETALTDLRGVVNDVTFGTEREALRASVTAMAATVTELSGALDQLRASSSAGSTTAGELAGNLERVNTAAAAVGARLGPLGLEDGVVARLDGALAAGGERAREFVHATAGATEAVAGLGEAGKAGRQAMQLIVRRAEATASGLEALERRLEWVVEAGDGVVDVAAGLVELKEAAGQGRDVLRGLHSDVEALRSAAGALEGALAGASTAADAAEGIAEDSRARSREVIERLTGEAEAAAARIAAVGRRMDDAIAGGADDLGGRLAALRAAADQGREALDSLRLHANSVEAKAASVDTALANSARSLNSSVDAGTRAIEAAAGRFAADLDAMRSAATAGTTSDTDEVADARAAV